MIKALLPRTHTGSTVIMSDLLNNDYVDPLSCRSECRVHQRCGPAWDVTGPPFLVLKFHIMSVIQLLQNAAAPGVISCWKIYNYVPVARQTLFSTVVSCHCYVVMWACLHVHMAKREGERKILDVIKKMSKGQWRAPAVDDEAWREVLLLF